MEGITMTTRIDKKLLGLLKEEAARQGRSMKDILDELVTDYLEDMEDMRTMTIV